MTALAVIGATDLAREAEALSHYLVGRPPSPRVVELYTSYVRSNPIELDAREQRLYALALRRRWLLSLIDAGLGLRRRNGGIRRRLLLMAALLETSTATYEAFLPPQRERLAVLWLLLVGIGGAVKALIGVVLIELLVWSR